MSWEAQNESSQLQNTEEEQNAQTARVSRPETGLKETNLNISLHLTDETGKPRKVKWQTLPHRTDGPWLL